jgi:hypothetical protein
MGASMPDDVEAMRRDLAGGAVGVLRRVVVDGRVVVRQGERREIGRELDAAVAATWKGMA